MAQRLVTAWSTRLALAVLLFVASVWLDHRTADAQGSPAGSPKRGGALRVAMIGEPPSLDAHMTTATITREIGAQIFETLYALDGRFETVPHLAESHEVQDGGKRYVIQLRKGVRFHNGKEMGAADVVASLKRWGAVSSTGKTIFKTVEAVEARGPSTVEIRLREPSVILPTALGAIGPFAAIYPKEVIDASGDGPLKELVGTGPFRLAEHRPDRHIKLVRFDGYAARSEAPSGLAGQRTAYLDELLFMPVPEEATRYAGLTSGEYGFAQQLRPDHYEGLRTATGVAPVVVKPYGWAVLVLNLKQGLLTDKRIRQAIQAAVTWIPRCWSPWAIATSSGWTRACSSRSRHGTRRPARASTTRRIRQRRAGSSRRPAIRASPCGGWSPPSTSTTTSRRWWSRASSRRSASRSTSRSPTGPRVVQRRNKAELWDIFSTAVVFDAEPSTSVQVLCEWPGWWCTPEKDGLLQAMAREPDAKKRLALWEKVQVLFYEDAARIKLGDYFRMDGRRADVQGYQPGPYMRFWNVWLDRK